MRAAIPHTANLLSASRRGQDVSQERTHSVWREPRHRGGPRLVAPPEPCHYLHARLEANDLRPGRPGRGWKKSQSVPAWRAPRRSWIPAIARRPSRRCGSYTMAGTSLRLARLRPGRPQLASGIPAPSRIYVDSLRRFMLERSCAARGALVAVGGLGHLRDGGEKLAIKMSPTRFGRDRRGIGRACVPALLARLFVARAPRLRECRVDQDAR